MSNSLLKMLFCPKNRRNIFLLCGTCFLTFFFLWTGTAHGQEGVSQTPYRLIFWNVENLFDTEDDSLKNDDAFTPMGDNHWTRKRYQQKLTNICRVVAATGERGDGGRFEMPEIVGLAEVENDKVLRDLCNGTSLRRYGYEFVHYESEDARGIDNALLYRSDRFKPFFTQTINVGDSSLELTTRDILLVEGTLPDGDTLIVLVNHFPSKRSGDASIAKRGHVAHILRATMDTLRERHPEASIIAMGDFNATPDEPEIERILTSGFEYENLMSKMEKGTGSHKYQGRWSYLDQIIVSRNMLDGSSPLQVCGGKAYVFALDFMLSDDERHLGKVPFRTYQAIKYIGGYSDHLAVGVDLILNHIP